MIELEDRFFNKIQINNKTNCWEWIAAKTSQGYGSFRLNGRDKSVHRLSYEFFYGINPGKLLVCHKCDNKKCVNPHHLFLGTQKDNIDDAIKKGRVANQEGEFNNSSKLTLIEVLEIKKKLFIGLEQKVIAIQHNVHPSTISAIKTGRNWSHI